MPAGAAGVGTILVIEDDQVLAEMYKIVLVQKGWKVDVANDGASGLARALEGDYSLVLLDLGLPDRSGLDVLADLRARPGAVDLPVVIFSNYDDPELKRSAFSQGAMDYLLKADTTPALLARRIAALFEEAAKTS